LKILEVRPEGCWAECRQTAYVSSGTRLNLCSDESHTAPAVSASVGEMPPISQPLILKRGDTLILTRCQDPGASAVHYGGKMVQPARIACTLPEVFAQVRPGERIWFDDGKIGGIIRRVADDRDHLEVEITIARPNGEKLGPDKGINLPDTRLRMAALTEKDLQDLPFVAAHADFVGMSFVRRPQDVYDLQQRLAQLSAGHLGIVLKIETREAFENLPSLVLAAMRHPSTGVMIARGDLGVECGFERLAEVQEEILWFCEAAHLPVIWATQVLESLAKKGQPSRAEISDAAMGERAECVMLNKGPHVVEAVAVLDDILRRMQSHQSKKTSRLRPLHVSEIRGTHRPRSDPA
jgi:pyruvate kinase